jgi:aspartyl-tRNA(Asn)/glutamyl-tRNA(Gln) amidotransferase subunit B
MAAIAHVELVVGLEVHVELATRTKMFTACPSVACREFDHRQSEPNSCIDPLVLALPGTLPVINRRAVELAMTAGLALGCRIAPRTRWDRKSYFYPDLPKGYQISQYDLPLCFDGTVDLPATPRGPDEAPGASRRIGIIRAHLEEDAGKLLHEAPGGRPIDHSIADYNRAGTPLLEIVTQPDFRTADEVVAFCQHLRHLFRFLGLSEGVLQKGHMRFEPNINCVLTLDNGRLVRTPIVEVKNLNSFRSVRDAVEYEHRRQPERWLRDAREMGPGTKQTRGWDEAAGRTVLQREKEDAHDYRYFPDPDLLPLDIAPEWVESVRAALPEPPSRRAERYMNDYALSAREAAALTEERDVSDFFERAVEVAIGLGVPDTRAGRQAASLLLQSGARRANERTTARQAEQGQAAPPVLVTDLGITPDALAGLVRLREQGAISAASADDLFGRLCQPDHRGSDPEALARGAGLIIVRDDAALQAWVRAAIDENPRAAEDVRNGKDQALGRLVGAAMKHAQGRGDAQAIRRALLEALGRG